MPYVKSHQGLERHPKVHDLMNRMGWAAPECPFHDVALDVTIGKLHRFWWWCLEYAPTGDIRKFNDGQLAGSVGLNAAEGGRFVGAMVSSGWIDRGPEVFRVHDWPDYAGQYLKGSLFKRNPARWQETLGLYGLTLTVDVSCDGSETVNRQSHVNKQASKLSIPPPAARTKKKTPAEEIAEKLAAKHGVSL